MKKVLLIFAIFLLLCPGVKGVKADDLKLAEKAKSAILIEASTGKILFEKNHCKKFSNLDFLQKEIITKKF